MAWIDWDEFAETYDRVFLDDPLYIDTLRLIVEQIEGGNDKNILDLGCGTGSITYQLLGSFPEARIAGADPSQGMRDKFAARFQGNPNVSVSAGDGSDIPWPDGEFDLIVSNLALHHITHEEKGTCAREMARVLKKGGRLVYSDLFTEVDAPKEDPARCKDIIEKMVGWALYCLEHGAFDKMVLLLKTVPMDLTEDGEYLTTTGVWARLLEDAGFGQFEVVEVPPEQYGMRLLCATRL